jgi:hypothetical protein
MNLRKLLVGRAKFEKRRIMRKERRSEPRWRAEYLATMVSGEGVRVGKRHARRR